MTKSSFNRAIKKLGYHPYKLVVKYLRDTEIFIIIGNICRHKLNPADIPRRLAMSNYVIQKNTSDPSWLSKLWTSDEANFNLNGIIFG